MAERFLHSPSVLVPIMQMINDGIGLLLGLAPVAALVALVLAGLALRNQGSALQNGRFGLWMFWAAVMLTLPARNFRPAALAGFRWNLRKFSPL